MNTTDSENILLTVTHINDCDNNIYKIMFFNRFKISLILVKYYLRSSTIYIYIIYLRSSKMLKNQRNMYMCKCVYLCNFTITKWVLSLESHNLFITTTCKSLLQITSTQQLQEKIPQCISKMLCIVYIVYLHKYVFIVRLLKRYL